MSKNFSEVVDEILQEDQRYQSEVYAFVHEGLNHTLKGLKRSGNSQRHVSCQELLTGLRDYALKEFGPMSKSVLNEWGVYSCEDFGHIVFNLVNTKWLGKTDADSPNAFKEGFNFDEAFVKPFEPRAEGEMAIKPRQVGPGKKRNTGKPSAADFSG